MAIPKNFLRPVSFAATAAATFAAWIAGPSVAQATIMAAGSYAAPVTGSLVFQPASGAAKAIRLPSATDVQGTAPGVYNLDLSGTLSLGGMLSATSALAVASSSVDGAAGAGNTTDGGTILDGLSITVPGLFSLSAASVTGEAMIAGDYGALTETGGALFSGLSVNGAASDLTYAPANAPLFSGGGLTVLANTESVTGDGSSLAGLLTAAISLDFVNVAFIDRGVAGVLNGSLDVGAAYATEAATADVPLPEPSAALVLGAGLVGAAAARRSPRKA